MKKLNTSQLVKAALLTALSIIFTRYLAIMITPTLRISIGFVAIMIAGLLYGPIVGAVVGIVSDIIGLILNAQGTPHLGFTLSSALTGVIPGIISMYYLKKDFINRNKVLIASVISALLVGLFVHLTLNTIWLTQLMGRGFINIVVPRALKTLIEIVIVTILIPIFVKILHDK